MKTLIISFACCFAVSVYGQKLQRQEVPEDVLNNFENVYPGLEGVSWEKDGDLFEAEWKQDGTEVSVIFDKSGGYVQTETEIPTDSLPGTIHDYVEKKMPDQKIEEATEVSKANGKISFEIEVNDKDYLFNSKGELIKSKSEDTGDNSDD